MRKVFLGLALTALVVGTMNCSDEPTDTNNNNPTPGADAGGTPGPDASQNPPGPDAGADANNVPSTDLVAHAPVTSCTPPAATYDPNFTANGWCDQVANVICDRKAACCYANDATALAECKRLAGAECRRSETAARIASGQYKLDLAKAKACLDAEAKKTVCGGSGLSGLTLPICDSGFMFTAGSNSGGACFNDFDCSASTCGRVPGTCSPLTCGAYKALNDACNINEVRADVLSCDPATTYCDTTANKCLALLADNSPCASPLGSFACQSGYCDRTLAAPVCKPKSTAGGACNEDYACPYGYHCGKGKVCTQELGAAGDDCTRDSNCKIGLYCKKATGSAFGLCTEPTAAGSTCANSTECGAGNTCATPVGGTGKVCFAHDKALDAVCKHDADCAFGLWCPNATGKCAAQIGFDQSCSVSGECQQPFSCLGASGSKKCGLSLAGTKGSGTTCSQDSECQTGLTCQRPTGQCSGSVTRTCKAPQADSSACCEEKDCVSLSCEANLCKPKCL